MVEGGRINKGLVTMAPAVIRKPEAAPSPAHWEVSPSPQACTLLQTGTARRRKEARIQGRCHWWASWGLLAAAEVSGTTGD